MEKDVQEQNQYAKQTVPITNYCKEVPRTTKPHAHHSLFKPSAFQPKIYFLKIYKQNPHVLFVVLPIKC